MRRLQPLPLWPSGWRAPHWARWRPASQVRRGISRHRTIGIALTLTPAIETGTASLSSSPGGRAIPGRLILSDLIARRVKNRLPRLRRSRRAHSTHRKCPNIMSRRSGRILRAMRSRPRHTRRLRRHTRPRRSIMSRPSGRTLRAMGSHPRHTHSLRWFSRPRQSIMSRPSGRTFRAMGGCPRHTRRLCHLTRPRRRPLDSPRRALHPCRPRATSKIFSPPSSTRRRLGRNTPNIRPVPLPAPTMRSLRSTMSLTKTSSARMTSTSRSPSGKRELGFLCRP